MKSSLLDESLKGSDFIQVPILYGFSDLQAPAWLNGLTNGIQDDLRLTAFSVPLSRLVRKYINNFHTHRRDFLVTKL